MTILRLMSMARRILGLFGWKVEGYIPDEIKKCVVIAVPHTSAWDFPLGLFARAAIGKDIKYVGKKSLFKPPLGWIMRALGGYPVDRSTSQNFVASVIQIFDSQDEFMLTLAPEGTRKKVEKFKTGFYYIALGAKVPLILVKFDYAEKAIKFDPVAFVPTGDVEADMAYLWDYFKGVKGKVPEYSVN